MIRNCSRMSPRLKLFTKGEFPMVNCKPTKWYMETHHSVGNGASNLAGKPPGYQTASCSKHNFTFEPDRKGSISYRSVKANCFHGLILSYHKSQRVSRKPLCPPDQVQLMQIHWSWPNLQIKVISVLGWCRNFSIQSGDKIIGHLLRLLVTASILIFGSLQDNLA